LDPSRPLSPLGRAPDQEDNLRYPRAVMSFPTRTAFCFILWIFASAGHAADVVMEGAAPGDASRFFDLPFSVPEGTREVEVRHVNLTSGNVLDWGLRDPNGFRGWGGGNPENAVVGELAASRSYLPGPLPSGTWNVIVGKASIATKPARYRVEVTFRKTPTLAPRTERRAYVPAAPLKAERRWYAGDFHVHSRESGDARPSLEETAAFARSRGMDFIHLSEHNTSSGVSLIPAVQDKHPDLLLIPGVEFTTYWGHGNGIGVTEPVEFRMGVGGRDIHGAVADIRAQGALFSINHPVLDMGPLCIGCAWQQPLPNGGVDAVEIATGGWEEGGVLFDEGAITFWDWVCSRGIHAAAIGGSDDHRAGQSDTRLQSIIGEPTTMVQADGLSVRGIVDAIREGRTVVKLGGPDDPMVELSATGERHGDTLVTERSRLTARVTGGLGAHVRFVRDGVALPAVQVDRPDFVLEADVEAPARGEERWRAEVLRDGRPRTVTSHLWFARALGQAGVKPLPDVPVPSSCGCDSAPWASGLALLALAGLWRRRLRARQ